MTSIHPFPMCCGRNFAMDDLSGDSVGLADVTSSRTSVHPALQMVSFRWR